MKHKVICMDCGKTERILIDDKKIKSNWKYYGKINVNACQTDKFHYIQKDPAKGFGDEDNWEKVPNRCYNPSVKPKLVEMWVCPECSKKLEAQNVE